MHFMDFANGFPIFANAFLNFANAFPNYENVKKFVKFHANPCKIHEFFTLLSKTHGFSQILFYQNTLQLKGFMKM